MLQNNAILEIEDKRKIAFIKTYPATVTYDMHHLIIFFMTDQMSKFVTFITDGRGGGGRHNSGSYKPL